MGTRVWAGCWIVLALLGCLALAVPQSRPPRLVAAPGAPRPDGCTIENALSRAEPPPGLQEIGVVSAVALSDGACARYLLRHEACAYGGEVVYGLQTASASPGDDAAPLACQARIARRPGAG
jgi:hypothetical protein